MLPEEFIDRFWDAHPAREVIGAIEAAAAAEQGLEPVLLHGHCHQKALWGVQTSAGLLRRLVGGRLRVLDTGCCGMAGAFGFEGEHYDISVRAAERVLLPRLRETSDTTLILADGFSCREQIRQLSGLRAHHLAEVLNDHLVDVVNHP